MSIKLIMTPGGLVDPDDIAFNSAAAPGPQFDTQQFRVNTGPIRLSGNGGEVESVGNTKYVHSDAGTPGGSVMATLRRGANASVELIPGVPGTRTLLAAAERDGLIEFREGRYQDVKSTTGERASLPTQTEAPASAPADPGAGAFDPQDDADWALDIEPLPQSAYDGAVASVVGVVVNGSATFEDAAKRLAGSAAIEPALAMEYVQKGYEMHERTVARAMAPLGLTGERLQQFYKSTKAQPAKLQDAIQQLVYQRDLSGFKALAVAFKVANPVDTSTLKAAGFETSIDRESGDVMVKRPGGNWVKASALK